MQYCKKIYPIVAMFIILLVSSCGDGKNVRDWLYVMDHAKAIDMVQEKGKLFERYNVGGHNEKQNIEIIEIILDTLCEMLPDDDPRKAHINKENEGQ